MNNLSVVNDRSNKEASYIKIIDEKGNTLVYFHGPMSMAAAGAFIILRENPGNIRIAANHWKELKNA